MLASVTRADIHEVDDGGPTTAADQAVAARTFYEQLLGGRQMWPTGRRAGAGRLWFLFGETLIETGPIRDGGADPIEIGMDAPNDAAARCWDAGYTVRLLKRESAVMLSVIDPFGRQIVLAPAR